VLNFLFFYFFIFFYIGLPFATPKPTQKKNVKKKKKSFTATPSSYRLGLPADPAIRPGARPVKKYLSGFKKPQLGGYTFLVFFPLTRAVAWYSWPVFQP
jgi:chlorite dismutase